MRRRFARDVTAIRQGEDAIRRADKLAAMGRMAASIAHEIRNPLEIAKNLAYLLAHDEGPENTHGELLATLQEQLTHMAEISSRTLSVARQGTSPASVSIAAILDETLALMRTNLMAKHVTIDRRFVTAGEVIGYAGPLRQLVVNLIANATDALPSSGGRITLHVADTQHPATGIGGVHLLVGDNGSGIPMAYRSKLFPHFSPPSRTTAPASAGGCARELWRHMAARSVSGLGLMGPAPARASTSFCRS